MLIHYRMLCKTSNSCQILTTIITIINLNTVIETKRWLVTSNGRYVNIWDYRLLIRTYIPERVINDNGITIMWDVPAVTDRTVLANQPDIVLHDKEEKTCLLTDITIPDD